MARVRQARAEDGRLPLLLRAHACCRSPPSSRSCELLRKRSVMHFLGSDIRGRPPEELEWARKAGARRRRLVRRGPLGARRARRPAGHRRRRDQALAAVRDRPAGRPARAVVALAQGNGRGPRRVRTARSRPRARRGRRPRRGVRALPRRGHRRRPAERGLVRRVRDRGDGARQARRLLPARGGGAPHRGGVRHRGADRPCDEGDAAGRPRPAHVVAGERSGASAPRVAPTSSACTTSRTSPIACSISTLACSEARTGAEAARSPLGDLRARRPRVAHPRDAAPAAVHALPAAEGVRARRDHDRDDRGGARSRCSWASRARSSASTSTRRKRPGSSR